jgi:two-component system, OmpR family, response regulator BaeR
MTSRFAAQLILIVEDEPKIALVLADYLHAAHYATAHLASGLEVAAFVRARQPALILLDLMLPGRSGLEVCREVRSFSDVPIIMVTAMVEEIDRLLGLGLGADDYVCKPFSPREIVARVGSVLRRGRTTVPRDESAGSVHAVGPFVLDELRMRVSYVGQRMELTTSEYRLLRTLVLQPGRVFSRSQLLVELHGADDETFDRAIDTHIKNLRKKLTKIDAASSPLRSVYGVGYQLDLE